MEDQANNSWIQDDPLFNESNNDLGAHGNLTSPPQNSAIPLMPVPSPHFDPFETENSVPYFELGDLDPEVLPIFRDLCETGSASTSWVLSNFGTEKLALNSDQHLAIAGPSPILPPDLNQSFQHTHIAKPTTSIAPTPWPMISTKPGRYHNAEAFIDGLKSGITLENIPPHDWYYCELSENLSQLNFTAVEIIVFLPSLYENYEMARRFVFNGLTNPAHYEILKAHRFGEEYSDWYRSIAAISRKYIDAMRGPGWRAASSKEQMNMWSRKRTDKKGVKQWRSNLLHQQISMLKFTPDRIRYGSNFLQPPAVPFADLLRGVKKIPQGHDAADLTRAIDFVVGPGSTYRDKYGRLITWMFPTDLPEIMGIIGPTQIVMKHLDYEVQERWTRRENEKIAEERVAATQYKAPTSRMSSFHQSSRASSAGNGQLTIDARMPQYKSTPTTNQAEKEPHDGLGRPFPLDLHQQNIDFAKANNLSAYQDTVQETFQEQQNDEILPSANIQDSVLLSPANNFIFDPSTPIQAMIQAQLDEDLKFAATMRMDDEEFQEMMAVPMTDSEYKDLFGDPAPAYM